MAWLILLVADVACASRLSAQAALPTLHVAVAPSVLGVRGIKADILKTWTQYLQSTSGRYYQAACRPSAFWVASEQSRWPCYNLGAVYLSDDALPEVRSIQRVMEREPGVAFNRPRADSALAF